MKTDKIEPYLTEFLLPRPLNRSVHFGLQFTKIGKADELRTEIKDKGGETRNRGGAKGGGGEGE